MAIQSYYFSACCDAGVVNTFDIETTNFSVGDVVVYNNECYGNTGNISLDAPDYTFNTPDYTGPSACADCIAVYPCIYTFSACCVDSGFTFSLVNAEIPQSLSVGQTWRVTVKNMTALYNQHEFDGCAVIVTGTSVTVYSGNTYQISLTGDYVDCNTCKSTDIDCCVSGTIDSTLAYYTDCCGNFVSGGNVSDVVCFNPSYPFRGFNSWGTSCSVPCITPTPTPSITPTQTITPSPTSTPLPCVCTQYQLVNTSLTETANFTYYDCYYYEQNDFIPPDSIFEICCCSGTLIVPSYVNVTLIGGCSEYEPGPTPSNTPTPTVTPSVTTTTTIQCSEDYCLNTGLLPTYDGTYYSAGTYNGFLYFTGGTEPGYIFFNNTSWCLSDTLGGVCILSGPIPYTTNCPDFDDTLFYSGVCVTTTTTTNPCSTFDFEAYFDCDYTTTTTTSVDCDNTGIEFEVSAYTTTTTTICTGTSVSATFTRYTTTTTTIPTTTTTTTLTVTFNGVVTYTVFDEPVTCPNITFNFQDCDTGQNYYVAEQPKYGNIPINVGEVYQLYINSYLVCATYLGTSHQSSNAFLGDLMFINPDCDTCLSTL